MIPSLPAAPAGDPSAAAITGAEGAELAREELADPIYASHDPTLLEMVRDWVSDWLTRLTEQITGAVPGGWWTLIGVLLVLAALFVGLRLYLGPSQRSRKRGPLLPASTADSAADHRRDAERHAAEGDFAGAIRERLRAVGKDLEDRAIIEPRAGRTATELADETAAVLPEHRSALRGAASMFNDVWYGKREAGAQGYAELCELDERLRSSRPRASAEALG